MKESQLQFVVRHLKENGRISRNFCLQNRITRLSAIALSLKKQGWNLLGRGERTYGGYGRGWDYIYIWRDWKPIHTPTLITNNQVIQ